jgi:sec-independent protein translocase protein TatB
MFEIAWSELLLVLIVAIVVVGPKELPGMLRTFGRMLGKLRRSADDFRRQFDESVKEAGGEDLQRELNELRRNNPLNEIRNTIEQAAREATDPPKLPTPDTYLGKAEDPPVGHETFTDPDLPAPPLPASPGIGAQPQPPAAADPAPASATSEGTAAANEQQAGASPGHEPMMNGQHRPLN